MQYLEATALYFQEPRAFCVRPRGTSTSNKSAVLLSFVLCLCWVLRHWDWDFQGLSNMIGATRNGRGYPGVPGCSTLRWSNLNYGRSGAAQQYSSVVLPELVAVHQHT